MSKKKKIDLHNLTPEEELKYEIAEELGLLDRVMKDGWRSLSAKGNRPGGRPYDPPEKRNEKTGGRESGIKSGKFPVSRKKRMRYNGDSNFTGQQEEP